MRRTLTNARIPGERGLFGSGINVVIDDGIITDIEFVGQTSAFTLPVMVSSVLPALASSCVTVPTVTPDVTLTVNGVVTLLAV